MENLGIRMMKARFKNNLTIKEAAEKLGISPPHLQQLRAGQKQDPGQKAH